MSLDLENGSIDDYLHVVMILYQTDLKHDSLIREFCCQMEFENNIIFYMVEMAYGSQPFLFTSSDCSRHLQLRCDIPLCHKENMVNTAIQRLLPSDWKAVAWIDSVVQFQNEQWALDTLCLLNGSRDIVQLFSHSLFVDSAEQVDTVSNSFSFCYERGLTVNQSLLNDSQSGYAWACNRYAYDKMGGLFEYSFLGLSDSIFTSCFSNSVLKTIDSSCHKDYKALALSFQKRVRSLRLGYVPGVISYLSNSYVKKRNSILLTYFWKPSMISKNVDGVIVPSDFIPYLLAQDIMNSLQKVE